MTSARHRSPAAPPPAVLVLGATGPSGTAILTHLLTSPATAHLTLIVYCRNPLGLGDIRFDTRVQVVQGQLIRPTSGSNRESIAHDGFELTDELRHILERTDITLKAVISALGPKIDDAIWAAVKFWNWFTKSTKTEPTTPISTCYELILLHLERRTVLPRFVALGTVSIVIPQDRFSLFRFIARSVIRLFAPAAFREIMAIQSVFERRETDTPFARDVGSWCVPRVALLRNGEGTEPTAGVVGKVGQVLYRQDLARFFVEAAMRDESEGETVEGARAKEKRFPAIASTRRGWWSM